MTKEMAVTKASFPCKEGGVGEAKFRAISKNDTTGHATMTGKERIANILQRKPVDRIGLFEHFWGDTEKKWRSEGHIAPEATLADHFGFDVQNCWANNLVADLDFEPETVEETEETRIVRDGNGALLRRHKLHDTTPEHIDFLVKDRAAWEEHIKPRLTPDPRRINFEDYSKGRAEAAAAGRFFCWSGVNVFESIHPVCGHEHMLMGMLTDPDWVKDMVSTYADLTVILMEILFEREGLPDGVWFYEDMGFKQHPFVSPDMYREIIQPAHAKTIAYAHSRGLPVIMHSCGYVEPLLPGMIEAGIDCLQVIEVKAGMDLLKLHADYGDKLSFMGGIDVRVLYTNDKAEIERELLAKIPVVKGGYGYVLHSDHSIPDQVEYESYRHFVERGLELGAYR
jgi:uroporphyrinogen decarboxylase